MQLDDGRAGIGARTRKGAAVNVDGNTRSLRKDNGTAGDITARCAGVKGTAIDINLSAFCTQVNQLGVELTGVAIEITAVNNSCCLGRVLRQRTVAVEITARDIELGCVARINHHGLIGVAAHKGTARNHNGAVGHEANTPVVLDVKGVGVCCRVREIDITLKLVVKEGEITALNRQCAATAGARCLERIACRIGAAVSAADNGHLGGGAAANQNSLAACCGDIDALQRDSACRKVHVGRACKGDNLRARLTRNGVGRAVTEGLGCGYADARLHLNGAARRHIRHGVSQRIIRADLRTRVVLCHELTCGGNADNGKREHQNSQDGKQ